MHVQRDVSHVRSQRKTWDSSSGSVNCTNARGKSRNTSGIAPTLRPSPAPGRHAGAVHYPGTVSAGPVTVPSARVSLSTSSVYPESTASGFERATRLGYDGVEVMVGIDPVSTNIDAVRGLRDYHEIPVVSVHAPCLLITQRVWGNDPWGKLE